MKRRLLTIDVAHRYPWLNLEIGELVAHVKVGFPHLEIRSFYQVVPDMDVIIGISPRAGDLIVIHADSITADSGLKICHLLASVVPNVPVIRFGSHQVFSAGRQFTDIVGNDVSAVLEEISRLTGIPRRDLPPQCGFPAADFSTLPPFFIFNFPLRSSKGCLNRCPFCERGREGGLVRKDPSILADEIAGAVEKHRARSLTFWDPMLNSSPSHFEQVCDIVQHANLPWRSNGMTIRNLSREMVRRMAESGCYLASFGIESFSPEVSSGKKLTFDEVLQVRTWLYDEGIMMLGFFIIGLEGDTFARAMRTIDLAAQLDLDITIFSPAIALSGTPLENWVKSNGRFLPNTGPAHLQNRADIHFETDSFSQKDRIRALAATSRFKERNQLSKQHLRCRLGGPESPSSPENIRWHQPSPMN